ncbi:fluoride efflux transporter FluC [Streptomyces sp. NPDC102402]|uniref:fluoride efflux transporter FluC n=1 Tax=Streptomyces sp. NPDC102402 TaxID=3366169 RepID=UPI0038278059
MSGGSPTPERPPLGPDAGLAPPAERGETRGAGGAGGRRVLAVIAAGGAVGATARYAAMSAWPAGGDGFPWAVLTVNVTGCALIGVLMVLAAERATVAHPLVRPFLGVGVLGGFTTFSTYAADVARLLTRQEVGTAMAYAAATAVAALGAVWGAAAVTRALADRRGRAT